MNEEKIAEALNEIRKLKLISPRLIAEKLKINQSEAELIIAMLIVKGVLEEVTCKEGSSLCNICPLKNSCSRLPVKSIKLYRIRKERVKKQF